MSGFAEFFDAYSLRARIYPGLLALLPVTVIVVVLWPRSPTQALWPVAVTAGLMFFLTNWVRDRGVELQKRLLRQWDGFPTTRRLRWAGAATDPEFARRRTRLEQLIGISLPDATDENGEHADAVYAAAVRGLRGWVRQRPDAFPLVQHENAAYGFRRNLLALKPIGVALSIAGLVFDTAWGLAVDVSVAVAVLAVVHSLILASWLTVVRQAWVKEQAERYADELFSALMSPTATEVL